MRLNTVPLPLISFVLIFWENICVKDAERRERALENAAALNEVARGKRSGSAIADNPEMVAREAGLATPEEVPSWLKAWMFVSEQSMLYQSVMSAPSAPLNE